MLRRLLHRLPPCPCVQIAWLKGELCVALEAERAASLRADELEAALVQVADKRHLDETKRSLQQQVSNTRSQQGTRGGGGGARHLHRMQSYLFGSRPSRTSFMLRVSWSRPSVVRHRLVPLPG
jgi:hypothetical protein